MVLLAPSIKLQRDMVDGGNGKALLKRADSATFSGLLIDCLRRSTHQQKYSE